MKAFQMNVSGRPILEYSLSIIVQVSGHAVLEENGPIYGVRIVVLTQNSNDVGTIPGTPKILENLNLPPDFLGGCRVLGNFGNHLICAFVGLIQRDYAISATVIHIDFAVELLEAVPGNGFSGRHGVGG
jgi:hypothetical protein